jgi:hypothetical protein
MVELSVRQLMPFLVVGVQCFIFFSVESVEMKFALVKKSYKTFTAIIFEY